MTDGAPSDVVDHLKRYVRTNPDAGVDEILGATGVDLEHITLVEELVAADDVEDVAIASTDEGDSDESPESDETPEEESREGGSSPDDPEGETVETGDEPDKYRRVYLDAVERADREPWEYVEEEAVREALAEIGFEELLDNGALFDIRGWRTADVSENDEEPRRRWFYPSGNEPRPNEFCRFDQLLTEAAPDEYEPHYFRVAPSSKDPATKFGSWKTDEARLTVDEAVDWMESGGNVGIAGRPEGPLVNVDIDDDEETTPDDVPTSLRARSRSRTGWHTWYFDENNEIPNIPTDEYGEVRTNWQYVVAPGSFVASTSEAIPDDADEPGYYTVEDEEPVVSIEYEDLPEVFHEFAEEIEQAEEEAEESAINDEHHEYDDENDNDCRSAVFDVEAGDLVTGKDPSDRFTSIFHDSGTHSNMSASNDLLHCWRHGVTHGGLQALATLSDVDHVRSYGCGDIGAPKKHSNAGPNRLKGDWRLVWGAWHEAKDRGAIPNDDPIPYSALRELAVADDLVDRDDLIERDVDTGEVVCDDTEETYLALPPGVYNDVLEHVETEYDVEPGRDAIGDSTAEPVSTLPLDRLDALDTEERKRYARSHGVEWPTTSDVRDRLEGKILQAVRSQASSVIDAPTSVGKSYTVATTPWLNHASTTNEQPVVHLHKTRDARDQAAGASDRANVSYRVLKGRKERCPVAHGDHNPNPDGEDPDVVVTIGGTPASEWLDAVCDGKGIPFSVAHQYLAEHSDQDVVLPCEADDTECRAMTQWDGIPWTDDGNAAVDVIHATHAFARVPSLVDGCNVILDEQPDFGADLDQDTVRSAITAYLRAVDAPRDTFEGLVELATPFDDDGFVDRTAVVNTRNDMQAVLDQEEPPMPWYLENDDAHALAPALTRAVWHALRDTEPDRNGRRTGVSLHEPPRFDDSGENYIADRVTVVVDDENTVRTVRVTPWFDAARSVIGLDAHPSMHLWQQNTVAGVSRESLLDPTERQLWRRFERGLTVVQVGEATRPFTSGEYFDEGGTTAVLEHLRDHYGAEFSTAITASSVERQTEQIMRDVGIDDPETMHYGEEKSRNDFGDEDVGLVNGCIDPGDDYVLDLLAERGLDAEPERVETDDGDVKRAKGRDFAGPDADAARDLLASVRENHVAQSAGRYARDADDPENSAVVFVRTDAIPPELVDVQAPGVERVFTDIQREILETLRSRPDGATAKEIADDLECTKRHVLDYLSNLDDVDREKGVGKHGADVYGAGEVPEHGEADLSLSAIDDEDEDAVVWTLAVHDQLDTTPGLDAATGGRDGARGPAPPDDSDSGGSSERGET